MVHEDVGGERAQVKCSLQSHLTVTVCVCLYDRYSRKNIELDHASHIKFSPDGT